MKKIIAVIIALAVLAGGYIILLRPSHASQEILASDYSNNKAAFQNIAQYLTENKVSVEIKGLNASDSNYNIPKTDEDSYRKFNESIEEIMKMTFSSIISDGETVEFVYSDDGGILTRKECSVIYTKNDKVFGKPVTKLDEKGWFIYIEE